MSGEALALIVTGAVGILTILSTAVYIGRKIGSMEACIKAGFEHNNNVHNQIIGNVEHLRIETEKNSRHVARLEGLHEGAGG